MSEEYRVQLDVFSGPLDLLLFLIRRDELDIQDIQIARLTEQYVEYVRVLEQIDPNAAGDFLVLAATLLEMKSRALLPTPPIEALDDETDDPRNQLVRQLLQYKRFKDAAAALAESAEERRKRFVRRPADLPAELRGLDLEEIELWDLVRAFGKVMSAIGRGPGSHDVRYDERPIEWYTTSLLESLERGASRSFQSLFVESMTRAEIIGLFLALLELIRQQRLVAEQDRVHGEIYLFLLEEAEPFDAPGVDPGPLLRINPTAEPDLPATESEHEQAE